MENENIDIQEDITDSQLSENDIVFEWEIDEKTNHDRSRVWYVVMTSVALALLLYSIYTANFLFAIAIILVVFIVIIQDYFPTQKLPFFITTRGIILDQKFRDYRQFKSFYIIYEPPSVKRLYFEFKGLRPDLSINLLDNNPLQIREFLLEVLTENREKEDESLTDVFETFLKL